MAPFLSATGCVVDGVVGNEGDAFPHPLIVIDTPPSMASKAATVDSRPSTRSSRSFCSFITPTEEGSWRERYGYICPSHVAFVTTTRPGYSRRTCVTTDRLIWIFQRMDFEPVGSENAIRAVAASAGAIDTPRPARRVRVGTRSRTTR